MDAAAAQSFAATESAASTAKAAFKKTRRSNLACIAMIVLSRR
jgi:hypothetical protein